MGVRRAFVLIQILTAAGLIADGLGIETAFYFMAGAALLAAPPIFLLPTKPS